MKKGYRLSSDRAYFNYRQLKQAQFASPMGFRGVVDNAISGANSLASGVGRRVLDPLRSGLRNSNKQLMQGIAEAGDALGPNELAKAQGRMATNADNIKRLNRANTGVGYGVAGLGALGAGGVGLAGINAMRGNQQGY